MYVCKTYANMYNTYILMYIAHCKLSLKLGVIERKAADNTTDLHRIYTSGQYVYYTHRPH